LSKKTEKTSAQKTLNLFVLFIFLVSAILIIVALSFQIRKTKDVPDPTSDIVISCLYSVATSLIASIIIVYASSKILGEPLDRFIKETNDYISKLSLLNQSATTTGLLQVFPRRADHQDLFFELLSKRWQSFDIMAVKLEFLCRDPRFEEFLINGCKRGAQVRILLIDTSNPQKLKERAKYEATSDFINKAHIAVSNVNRAIEKCRETVKDCNFDLEILGHNEYLPVTMMRVDDIMLYYSRTRNQSGANSPLYMVKKVPNGIFDLYSKDFDFLWNKYKQVSL
jgi:flagellar biogenesis protein FliO